MMGSNLAKAHQNSVTTSNGDAEKPPVSNIVELARRISKETEKLDAYFKETNTPYPSFDIDGPLDFPKLPEHMQKTRLEIIRATTELRDLVVGPSESLRWMAWDGANNTLSLQSILHYGIHKAFPLGSTTTFSSLLSSLSEATTSLTLKNLQRLLRHAITNRIFCEPSPGVIAHTSLSAALATNKPLQNWVGFCCDDLAPAAGKTIESMEKFPGSGEPTEAGFCVAEGTVGVEPMFVTMGRNPKRAQRFGSAMVSLTGGEGYEIHYLLDSYPWSNIDSISPTLAHPHPTFVDMGGSHGFICTALASRNRNMHFVVQDLGKMIASAPDLSEVKDVVTVDGKEEVVGSGILGDRVKFMAHDFHTEQPVKGADVYFFRWIWHNLSDKYALSVLRNLMPALKRGARIIINDHCLSEPGKESLWDDKIMRTMDLVMLSLLNATERSESDFETLFSTASPHFKFVGVTRPKGCRMSIVEAIWEGDDFDAYPIANGDKAESKSEGNGGPGLVVESIVAGTGPIEG